MTSGMPGQRLPFNCCPSLLDDAVEMLPSDARPLLIGWSSMAPVGYRLLRRTGPGEH